jgi:hypothetical protein
MVCFENDKDRKWACTWCQLRICRTCSDDLRAIPGKDLGTLLQARAKGEVVAAERAKMQEEGFSMVVEDIDGEEEGERKDREGGV